MTKPGLRLATWLLTMTVALPLAAQEDEAQAATPEPGKRWALVLQLPDDLVGNKRIEKALKPIAKKLKKAKAELVDQSEVDKQISEIEAETLGPDELISILDGVQAGHAILLVVTEVADKMHVAVHRYDFASDVRVSFEKLVKPNAIPKTIKKSLKDLLAAPLTIEPPSNGDPLLFGLAVTGLDKKTAKELGLAKPAGAMVTALNPAGVLANLGLKQGDVITRWGRKKLRKPGELVTLAAAEQSADAIKLEVWRDGALVELEPPEKAIGEAPASTAADTATDATAKSTADDAKPVAATADAAKAAATPTTTSSDGDEPPRRKLGARVKTVTPARAGSLGMPFPRGAFVSGIKAGSVATEGGLELGDVILTIDEQNVTHARDFAKLVRKSHADRKVALEVWRNKKSVTLHVFLGMPKRETKSVAKPESKPKAKTRTKPKAKPKARPGSNAASASKPASKADDAGAVAKPAPPE